MSKIIYFIPQIPALDISVRIIDENNYSHSLEHFDDIYEPEHIVNKLYLLPLQDLKAVVFQFSCTEPDVMAKLAKILDEYYTNKKISFYCCTNDTIFSSAVLLAAIDEHGKTVLEHFITTSAIVFIEDHQLGYMSIVKENEEYCIAMETVMPYSGEMSNLLDYIFPEHITFLPATRIRDPKKAENDVRKHLSSIKPPIVLKVDKLLESKNNNVDVAITGFWDYILASPDYYRTYCIDKKYEMGADIMSKSLLFIKSIQKLPCKKSIICYEPFANLKLCQSLYAYAQLSFQKMEKFPCVPIGTMVTLSVDKYFMPHVEYQSSNNFIKNGIIITFLETTFSVELIKNGNLENLDLNEIPIMIGFYDKRIQIGNEAMELKKDHNTFVVSDILKFMTSDLSTINIDHNWGFKATQNSDDKIFLEFDTYLRRRKTTPSFLISLHI